MSTEAWLHIQQRERDAKVWDMQGLMDSSFVQSEDSERLAHCSTQQLTWAAQAELPRPCPLPESLVDAINGLALAIDSVFCYDVCLMSYQMGPNRVLTAAATCPKLRSKMSGSAIDRRMILYMVCCQPACPCNGSIEVESPPDQGQARGGNYTTALQVTAAQLDHVAFLLRETPVD